MIAMFSQYEFTSDLLVTATSPPPLTSIIYTCDYICIKSVICASVSGFSIRKTATMHKSSLGP